MASAGDNPERMRSEAAFTHLAGVAPIPASSGRTHRHRLNRGGDRAANNAPCTPSCSSACATTNAHAPTSNAAPRKDSRKRTSCAGGHRGPIPARGGGGQRGSEDRAWPTAHQDPADQRALLTTPSMDACRRPAPSAPISPTWPPASSPGSRGRSRKPGSPTATYGTRPLSTPKHCARSSKRSTVQAGSAPTPVAG
ncbi:transposase [Saccharopolyspora shandongensis]|uniref:transposase n=1 Tax=Saccharopolyspora shandongensis TaxID=418495 RepID=UPI0033F40A6A